MNGQFKKLIKGVELRNDNGRGMTLLNANGDVDASTLGYQYTIQTTTQIRAKVIKQKFYEVPIAEFVSVIPGTGAWLEDIKTNLVYDVAGSFESGIINNAVGHSQIATVDVGTAPITTKIVTWAKGYQYTVPEVQKALASNNWDVVSSKMEALKRNWDLGLQKVAFLGLLTDITGVPGLLTNSQVNINTTAIQENISAMDEDEFAALVAGIMALYFANSNNTVLPDTFIIPMDDYLGLVAPIAAGFPVVSKMTYLTQAFKEATGNPNFKIKGLAYAIAANNAGYTAANGKDRYVLYRNDVDTLAIDLPVDFYLSPAGTANNFQWQGIGAGQFTGVTVYRPAEVLYFDHD
jgi:hypothetical protein